MAHKINLDICTQCGYCINVCPSEAIEEIEDGYWIDPELCCDCRACAENCEQGAIEEEE